MSKKISIITCRRSVQDKRRKTNRVARVRPRNVGIPKISHADGASCKAVLFVPRENKRFRTYVAYPTTRHAIYLQTRFYSNESSPASLNRTAGAHASSRSLSKQQREWLFRSAFCYRFGRLHTRDVYTNYVHEQNVNETFRTGYYEIGIRP